MIANIWLTFTKIVAIQFIISNMTRNMSVSNIVSIGNYSISKLKCHHHRLYFTVWGFHQFFRCRLKRQHLSNDLAQFHSLNLSVIFAFVFCNYKFMQRFSIAISLSLLNCLVIFWMAPSWWVIITKHTYVGKPHL